MEEKEDIMEVYWSKTRDVLLVSFSHNYMK